MTAGRSGRGVGRERVVFCSECARSTTVVGSGAAAAVGGAERCLSSTSLTMSLGIKSSAIRWVSGTHNSSPPIRHGAHADIATREILADRARDDVAEFLLDDFEVLGRERMGVHEGVHRWEEVAGRGRVERP